MIGLHGALPGEVFAYARQRQVALAAEVERERQAHYSRIETSEPLLSRLLFWLGFERTTQTTYCYSAPQPVCC